MLDVQEVTFAYQHKNTLKNISFSVNRGAHTCIIGESGCGKSTLLKAIYGLLDLDEGKVFWNGEQVLGPAFNLVPGHDKMKYLAQEDHLMPYTTVSENIKKFLSRQEAQWSQQRTEELLEVIDMTSFADTKVKNLSGGQKQRVALAQVLAKEPELLLLDEPFNFIDNFRKNKLRRNLFNYLKKQQITCIFATHDSTDMLGFADQALVMKEGKILANASPEQLFNEPKSFYIASLFQEVNQISAKYFEGFSSTGYFLIYPSEIKIDEKGQLSATVIQSYFNGTNHFIKAQLKQGESIFFLESHAIKEKEKVQLCLPKELLKKRLVE
ncbi:MULTISPECIES: ABC transporter ATP-binding protein [Mesonia]|uniref:Fe(3+) ions import ATP-binding protein FbpC n=1 Tax=Mesonia oceanica TaxID=2687242 RepID=A0AC61Y3A0_9FLAO|nr:MULTISPECIES: ABC transporter ATP-binding protein [Mesonia]MAN28679.1 ABC transporter ATP-binding protein [Mesonia sp.]MAQ41360.1 ABC transporter ATP-binding protein [Mesonia sp.]MBJ97459.1 ABC transporter ATP-binding protein [Flavobacteriaceae bacterium]VVU98933.1 Fe(3+) ions import ATP-binding protein FbpC [Mesonia oceanica]|tara:strand:+ start:1246 stop:2220 length:975 start_codon:yes stop_codon:yes gene_type:complete